MIEFIFFQHVTIFPLFSTFTQSYNHGVCKAQGRAAPVTPAQGRAAPVTPAGFVRAARPCPIVYDPLDSVRIRI